MLLVPGDNLELFFGRVQAPYTPYPNITLYNIVVSIFFSIVPILPQYKCRGTTGSTRPLNPAGRWLWAHIVISYLPELPGKSQPRQMLRVSALRFKRVPPWQPCPHLSRRPMRLRNALPSECISRRTLIVIADIIVVYLPRKISSGTPQRQPTVRRT